MKKIWEWVTSQLSDGLEKTTVGTITMFGVLGCIVYLVIKEGGSGAVESLLTTAMIVSATLMGVNSVTDIFKKTENTNTTSTTTATATATTTVAKNITETITNESNK